MVKKIFSKTLLVLILVLAVSLTGCTSKLNPSTDPAGSDTTEKYPNGPVKVIIHVAAGGGTDIMARTLFKHVEKKLGVPFVIENFAGAGGQLGYTNLIMSEPDGYTIGAITTMSIVTMELTRDVPFKFKENFQPISRVIDDPSTIFVQANSKFKTLDDLLDYAKQNPGKISWGGTMLWGAHHVHLEMLERASGVDMTYIPFDGASETRSAILGGHIDVAAGGISEYTDLVVEGKLRALAVGSQERHGDLPEVPTYLEKGYDVIIGSNRGFAVPKGTPADRVEILSKAIKEVMEDPEFLADAEKVGIKSTLAYMDTEVYTEQLNRLQDLMIVLLK